MKKIAQASMLKISNITSSLSDYFQRYSPNSNFCSKNEAPNHSKIDCDGSYSSPIRAKAFLKIIKEKPKNLCLDSVRIASNILSTSQMFKNCSQPLQSNIFSKDFCDGTVEKTTQAKNFALCAFCSDKA